MRLYLINNPRVIKKDVQLAEFIQGEFDGCLTVLFFGYVVYEITDSAVVRSRSLDKILFLPSGDDDVCPFFREQPGRLPAYA